MYVYVCVCVCVCVLLEAVAGRGGACLSWFGHMNGQQDRALRGEQVGLCLKRDMRSLYS